MAVIAKDGREGRREGGREGEKREAMTAYAACMVPDPSRPIHPHKTHATNSLFLLLLLLLGHHLPSPKAH